MRRLDPEFLVPSHTQPLRGREAVRKLLRDYRDGIQWVYVSTVRGANDGRTVDDLAESVRVFVLISVDSDHDNTATNTTTNVHPHPPQIALPPHLRAQPALDELYGQIDWSVRAIYGNELGWFDGQELDLYRLPHTESAHRLVALLGGEDRVLELATASAGKGEAGEAEEHEWALYLLKLLKDSGADDPKKGGKLSEDAIKGLQVRAMRGLAGSVMNTNGRGYLFQAAHELEHGVHMSESVLGQAFIDAIPIPLIFEVRVCVLNVVAVLLVGLGRIRIRLQIVTHPKNNPIRTPTQPRSMETHR